jgi:hypothetical protein
MQHLTAGAGARSKKLSDVIQVDPGPISRELQLQVSLNQVAARAKLAIFFT